MFDISQLLDQFDEMFEENHHKSFPAVFSKGQMLAVLNQIVHESAIV